MPYSSYDVDFTFTQLECVASAEGDNVDEPYLWIVFFKIDGEGYRYDTNGPRFVGAPVVRSHVSSALLLRPEHMRPGVVAGIDHVGEWKGQVKPIEALDPALTNFQLPGMFGYAVVLLEQDTSSFEQREAAHKRFNEAVGETIAAVLAEHAVAELLVPHLLKDILEAASARIQEQVIGVFMQYAGLPDLIDHDDIIGVAAATYVMDMPWQEPLGSDRFWSFGFENGEPGDEGAYYLGARYTFQPRPMYIPFGEEVGVRVHTGDNGEGASRLFELNGRAGTFATQDTVNGPRRFVTHRFDADELGEFDDTIGSIDIPDGFRVVLYERPGFRGPSVTIDRYGNTGGRFSLVRFPFMSDRAEIAVPRNAAVGPTRPMRQPLHDGMQASRVRTEAPAVRHTSAGPRERGHAALADRADPPTWKNRISSIEIIHEDVSGLIH